MTFRGLTFEHWKDKVFRCTDMIEKLEIELDPKMKCKIVEITSPDEHDVMMIVVDTSNFVVHNEFYASENYYDSDRNPRLTARQAGLWPKDERHNIYFMANDMLEDYFEEVKDESHIPRR